MCETRHYVLDFLPFPVTRKTLSLMFMRPTGTLELTTRFRVPSFIAYYFLPRIEGG